jgi:hypothetical protein
VSERRLKLALFRAWSMAKLHEIESKLKQKHPDRVDQITVVIDMLSNKIYYLNKHSLADYIYTLKTLSKTFPELEELIPDAETVQQLYDEG